MVGAGVLAGRALSLLPELDVELPAADIGAVIDIRRIGGDPDLHRRQAKRHQLVRNALQAFKREGQRKIAFGGVDMGDNVEAIGCAFSGGFLHLPEHGLGLRRSGDVADGADRLSA